jgi:hypothetical protein
MRYMDLETWGDLELVEVGLNDFDEAEWVRTRRLYGV